MSSPSQGRLPIKAAVLRSAGKPLIIENAYVEEPRPNEVLVKLVASGVCHTDMVVRDQFFKTPIPMILGHEGSGIVEKVGAAVTTVELGDHVVMTYMYCGLCAPCATGHPAHCEHMGLLNFGGSRMDGSCSSCAADGGELRILELNSTEQTDALREGRINAGISRVEIESPGIRRTTLRDEPMLAALPFDHPLAAVDGAMPLERIKDERFILYTSNPRPSLADHILSQFSCRNIALSNVVEVRQYDTALIMIAAGEGVSVVPASAQLSPSAAVVFRPFLEQVTSPIVLCHRDDDRTPELLAFHVVLAKSISEP